MIIFSALIGAANGILGYRLAVLLDVSIAGSMAVVTGTVFLMVFLFAPYRGVISSFLRRRTQKFEFAKATLLFHLYNHEGSNNERKECGADTIQTELHWGDSFTKSILLSQKQDESISVAHGIIKLTDKGRLNSINNYEKLFS